MVHADRQQLRQVLLNLLTNGCDAMADGGQLTIRITRTATPPVINGDSDLVSGLSGVSAGAAGAAEWVELDVTDTGSGIPPELLNRILEPFFTNKSEGKGTGLGLPICRRIVQEHGGKMEIISEVGKGTTIRIYLPASDNGDSHHDG
jgi:two-component system cell cycle sensor histidine kinase/response regulator CckA